MTTGAPGAAPLVIGLTGGIGSGKSTVAGLLGRHGADVVDVDGLGHDVLEPGGSAHQGVIDAFGEGVRAPDGSIDRAALAALVFGAEQRLPELEAISHPAINEAMAALVAASRAPVVVLDLAVLAESRLGHTPAGRLYHRVVVVETPLADRLVRLAGRGLPEDQARARIAAQASDDQRRRLADLVVPNDADLASLEQLVDRLWPTVVAWTTQTRS